MRVNTNRTCSVQPDATYVIVGGLGGLGREMARWLANRGAKHLILLSRSGPCTTAAQELITELNGEGVNVEAPVCDIADEVALGSVLDECTRRMPPIRGCIQGAMVMKVSVYTFSMHSELGAKRLTENPHRNVYFGISPSTTGSEPQNPKLGAPGACTRNYPT